MIGYVKGLNYEMKFSIIFFIILNISNVSFANEYGSVTGLDIPRYVSIKSDDANMRVGPSKNYPIFIKYVRPNFPIKVIEEYQDWRKIIDYEEHSGWIHKSLLKGERHGLIISIDQNNTKIYNTESGIQTGEIGNRAIIRLLKCKTNWCLIQKENHKGWIQKKFIWGVKENEEFNIGYFQTFYDLYFKSINFLKVYLS